jgi:hypothetical protein
MEIQGTCSFKKQEEKLIAKLSAILTRQPLILENTQEITIKLQGTQTTIPYTGTGILLTGDSIKLSDIL